MLDFNGYDIGKNVHAFQQGELRLAYDVNSGSLHILDESAYRLLQALKRLQADALEISAAAVQALLRQWREQDGGGSAEPETAWITEVWDELAQLQREGSLFSPPVEEQALGYPAEPLIKAMCLHVAHDCNLRCGYCFAGTGAFGGQRGLMDEATGKKAIDFILQASRHRQQCEVDLFGGEPLLNFERVKTLVHYGKNQAAALGKEIKFTLTTNAVLLRPAIQEFLEREEISVVLSLDGRPQIHDRMRPDVGGQGSYEQVKKHIQEFIARRPQTSAYATGLYYYVRGTYTHFNPDFDRDVRHMAELGIRQISMEPVVAQPGDSYAFQEGDTAAILAAYDRLGEDVLALREKDPEFSFFHFNVALEQGPCLPKRLSGCGAGHEYVAISPEGDIYPCHQFVGQERFKMGSVHAERPLRLEPRLVESFRAAHVFSKASCRACWARFTCSGGCHAANVNFTGGLQDVYALGCELQRKRLEVALYIRAKEIQRDSLKSGGKVDVQAD
ncbi:MAG: thioether cross-link-forming SCIFF peptide maturase [Peptococcaceae bacterium]|jgi:uncharacterized protein|nr:thioether cross-link-forming SCIFF peptide maturase [Peptococcaceae bacterium]